MQHIWSVTASAMALCLGCALPAAADPSECAGAVRIDPVALIDTGGGAATHVWGRENLSIPSTETDREGAAFRIRYPAGSFSPGGSAIRGGAGFQFAQPPAASACLSYKVRFPLDFDFAKGGKLPGLFGGAAPRGCIGEGQASGFSARLMWRRGGEGELYLYAPGREQRCGASIGRGSFRFRPGQWTEVTERVSLGSPGAGAGSIEVWIDDRLAVKAEGLRLGDERATTVDGMLFATFFGGDDESWASPRDQYADFADFRIAMAEK